LAWVIKTWLDEEGFSEVSGPVNVPCNLNFNHRKEALKPFDRDKGVFSIRASVGLQSVTASLPTIAHNPLQGHEREGAFE
jgi:hypothetical protein